MERDDGDIVRSTRAYAWKQRMLVSRRLQAKHNAINMLDLIDTEWFVQSAPNVL